MAKAAIGTVMIQEKMSSRIAVVWRILVLMMGLILGMAPASAAGLTSDLIERLTGWTRTFTLLDPDTWPFIPVPIVVTDPNTGTTGGVMPVFLYHDQLGAVRTIFAPDANDNTTLGAGATFRYLAYPSDDTQWWIIGGFQHTINRWVDLYYATGRTREQWWSFEGRFYWERDPTSRFYGLGNNSLEGKETNYTMEQLYFRALLGLNLSKNLQLALVEMPRYVRISRGPFDLPFIGTLFPTVKGLNGGSELTNMLQLSYDTRDSIDIPRRGVFMVFYGAVADRAFGSSISYTRFGGDLHGYVPFGQRFTLAMHAFLGYMPAGEEVPFWSMSSLGGEAGQLPTGQPLRGFGEQRFTDNNMVDLNMELRTRVFDARLFKTHGILELAPFAEAGKVFHTVRNNPLSALNPVGGLGFRIIIEPYVVAYLDFGYGGEGLAAFTGIYYPF